MNPGLSILRPLFLALCLASVGEARQDGGRSSKLGTAGKGGAQRAGGPARRPTRGDEKTPALRREAVRAADAELAIISNVPHVTVYLNGRQRGETDGNGLLSIQALAGGSYDVLVRKEGYAESRLTVRVAAGQSQVVKHDLRPLFREPDTIQGGLLNGRAVTLPAPEYPEGARGTGASGKVTVRVLVGELGEVISAEAESGHAALHGAAVASARRARFTPAYTSGRPARVSGTISYDFSPPSATQSYSSPSGRFLVAFPTSWQTLPRGNDYVTLGPAGGIKKREGREEVVVGAIVAYLPVRGADRMTPEQAFSATLRTLLAGNGYLSELSSARRRVVMAGAPAVESWLVGRTPSGYDERAQLTVRPTRDGVVFVVVVAPERDFGTYQPTFRQLTHGLTVHDR